MSNEPIISVSGLRGVIGDQLTPIVAARYVAAFCKTLKSGISSDIANPLLVVARDGRSSGPMLADVVTSTAIASGLDVAYVDTAATPTVGVLVHSLPNAIGGVQISASHNPVEYNGLKLFNSEGRVIPAVEGEKVLQSYRDGDSAFSSVCELGRLQPIADKHSEHIRRILATIDAEPIRTAKFRVLLDSNRGAGAAMARKLLDALGCQIEVCGEQPDGAFEHAPEPLAENLTTISDKVRQGGFDAGFCQDPDADRLAVIDENGRYIGEELTLALCLMQVLSQEVGNIAVNCATSSVNAAICEKFGAKISESKVGEANVVDEMKKTNAIFGGEGNGGPIDPHVGWVRDSFVGMARILAYLAKEKRALSQLVDELPKRVMLKDKVSFDPARLESVTPQLVERLQPQQVDTLDGIRFRFNTGWLLIRGSNTEPIVRLIAESRDQASAKNFVDVAKSALVDA